MVIGYYMYLYLIVIGKHLLHAYIVSDFGGRKQVIKVLKKFLFFLTYFRKYAILKPSKNGGHQNEVQLI